MKPHSGESLFDLSARLHFSFADASRKIKSKTVTDKFLEKLTDNLIRPGSRIFVEFQEKEKEYHHFLSYIPDSPQLFTAIRELKGTIADLNEKNFGTQKAKSKLPCLFEILEKKVKYIYNFIKNLENYLAGDK